LERADDGELRRTGVLLASRRLASGPGRVSEQRRNGATVKWRIGGGAGLQATQTPNAPDREARGAKSRAISRGGVFGPAHLQTGWRAKGSAAENSTPVVGDRWAEMKLSRLMETLTEVLDRSRVERRPAHEAAHEVAKARLSLAVEQKAAA